MGIRVLWSTHWVGGRAALAVSLLGLAPAVLAQSPAATPTAIKNPSMIITRTVNPRIAYRAVPTEINPVHAQVSLFPAREFHGALDGALGLLLGDDALGQRGSVGVAVGAAAGSGLTNGLQLPMAGGQRLLGATAGNTPLGTGATASGAVGGALQGATAGLGGFISSGAIQAVLPTQQGAGP